LHLGRKSKRRVLRLSQSERCMSKESKTSWNLCISCKWWQIEPDAKVAKDTAGLCIDEELQPFKLRVTGDSGCNRYMPGTPARAEGSSGKPPTAAPVR
jgi:hypothetical protein